MSYLSDLKEKMAERVPKRACCSRALLCGMLSARAKDDGEKILCPLPAGAPAELAGRLIAVQYTREPVFSAHGVGGRSVCLSFQSRSASSYLAGRRFLLPEGEGCPHCRPAFFRGVFLAAGRLSDIGREVRLEFSVGGWESEFRNLLEPVCGRLSAITRNGEAVLYCRSAGAVGDFFAVAEYETLTFDLINGTIESEYRNAVNRRANCETGNISKSIDASMRFLHLYRQMEAEGKTGLLPEELRETARLRVENPEVSLSVLGAMCVPSVSKSGMNHRLLKITRLCEEILAKQEKEGG